MQFLKSLNKASKFCTILFFILPLLLSGCGGGDAPATVPPPPQPIGLSAVGVPGQTTLNWAPSEGATSYNLYWSLGFPVLTSNSSKITGVTIPYIFSIGTNPNQPGLRYYFAVSAVNAGGETLSNTISIFLTTH